MITIPDTKSILLIHPPVVKPSEPPPGVARLAGVLRKNSITCQVLDANIEALLHLSGRSLKAEDTWTRRAASNIGSNIDTLRSPQAYTGNRDRYKRAVMDINRFMHMSGLPYGCHLSLSNYGDTGLSPVIVRDLLDSARSFEQNLFFPYFSNRLTDLFSTSTCEIVGFSVNFLSQALCAFAMAGWVRTHLPEARIVFGGGLVSSWMKIPGFANPFEDVVDDLVAGPGESALLEMAGSAGNVDPGGHLYDFQDFKRGEYLSPGLILPISASQGCYWRKCSFCPEKAENCAYTQFDPEDILCGARDAAPGQDPVMIHFLDNALSPKFMKHLISHPPGVPWYGFARITHHLADPDFVKGLRTSGCAMLKLGIESGDQAVLDALGKGIDLGLVSRALFALSSAGIPVYAYLLFGTPAENRQSAEKTKSFILSHAGLIDYLNLAVFNLPAHCREADSLETDDFYSGDLSLYRQFAHPQGWNRSSVRSYLEKEFKAEPDIRGIINRDPPFFTSNHAPLFSVLESGVFPAS